MVYKIYLYLMNKKGILKEMYKVPAWKRLMNDPNLKQFVSCPCWKIARVQILRPGDITYVT